MCLDMIAFALYQLKSTISIENQLPAILEGKVKSRDFTLIDTSKNYDLIYLEFSETEMLIKGVDYEDNNRNHVIKVPYAECTTQNIKETVNKKIYDKALKNSWPKVLVYEKSNYILNENCRFVIDGIKKANETVKTNDLKNCIYYKFIVEKGYFYYELLKAFPITSNETRRKISKKFEYFRKKDKLLMRFNILVANYCCIFEFDTEKLGSNSAYKKLITAAYISKDPFQLELYQITQIYGILELTEAYDTSESKILMNSDKEIWVIKEKCIFTKDDFVSLRIVNEKNRITFYEKKSQIIFTTDTNAIIMDKSKISYNPLFWFLKRPKNNINYVKIDENTYNHLEKIMSRIYAIKKKKFVVENFFFRLLQSDNLFKIIVNKIYETTGSSFGIFFTQLCKSLNIIDDSKMIILTESGTGEANFVRFIIARNLIIVNLIKRLEEVLLVIDNGIAYLIKLCLFFQLEDMINEKSYVNNEKIKALQEIGKLVNNEPKKDKIDLLEVYDRILSNKLILDVAVDCVLTQFNEDLFTFIGRISLDNLNLINF